MHALLPFFVSRPRATIDRLSSLRDVEKENARRHETVLWCLVNVNMTLKHFVEALKWLNQLLIVNGQSQKVRVPGHGHSSMHSMLWHRLGIQCVAFSYCLEMWIMQKRLKRC